MAVSPDSYAWLPTSALENAGCLTVVVGADPAAVESAFGAEPAGETPTPGADGEWAWFVHREGVTIVIEDNGFQGTLEAVLRPATRGPAKAASVFWNVNDLAKFTSCRRGQATTTVDLEEPDEDSLNALPHALRVLAALCSLDEDEPATEPVAVGAAMVETFTGIRFDADVLQEGELRRLTPPASPLDEVSRWTLSNEPALRAGIEALAPDDQRALAAWVTRAVIAEAGMEDEPEVASVLARLGDPAGVPGAGPALDALQARLMRARESRQNAASELDDGDDDVSHDLEARYALQRWLAVNIAKHLAHPDPAAAALICSEQACRLYVDSALERLDQFREDGEGRQSAGRAPNPRRQEFVDLLLRVLVTPRSQWEALSLGLPVPFTPEQKQKAMRRDRRRRNRGDFETYQIAESAYFDDQGRRIAGPGDKGSPEEVWDED